MRFISILTFDPAKTNPHDLPEMMERMSKLVETMRREGTLVDTGGRDSDMIEFKVTRTNGRTAVTDGPFAEAKEVVGGYAVLEAKIAITRSPSRTASSIRSATTQRATSTRSTRLPRDRPRRRSDCRSLAHRIAEADRAPLANDARRRQGRGSSAGCLRGGPLAVAGRGHSAQSRRVVDDDRETPRRRCDPARRDARAQVPRARALALGRGIKDRLCRSVRGDRRRSAAPHVRGVPSGRVEGGARRADAQVARRPHHRGDRPRVSHGGSDDRAAHRAREADACGGARSV